jgi:hypothetical protein
MYKIGFTLKTDADFDNAIFFGLNIAVWQKDEIIDYGGVIEFHTDHSVKINDAYFLKAYCQFKVR